jgi:hypothetical protein
MPGKTRPEAAAKSRSGDPAASSSQDRDLFTGDFCIRNTSQNILFKYELKLTKKGCN